MCFFQQSKRRYDLKMNKFNSAAIEKQKVEYYSVIGRLEITKGVTISDTELKVFEAELQKCETEIDAASFIVGATRRYKLMLDINNEPASSHQTETVMFPFVETVIEEPVSPNKNDNSSIEPQTVRDTEEFPLRRDEGNAACATNVEETGTENVSSNNSSSVQNENVENMPLTNTLVMVKVDDLQLTTTKEKSSIFIIYAVREGRDLGCEFTLKKRCKEFDRFECKSCRKIVDKARKTCPVSAEQNPAAIKVVNGTFAGFLKEKHNDSCCVESSATAFARSEKNVCVQFKGKYGGTAKQCYESHSRRLMQSSVQFNITAEDVAEGFKTFDVAKGALNKSSKRKGALVVPKLMNPDETIDKVATLLSKTTPNEETSYFLIGENQVSGTIVLGKL